MYRVPIRNLGDLGRIVPHFFRCEINDWRKTFFLYVVCSYLYASHWFRIGWVNLVGLVPKRAGLLAQKLSLTIRRLTLNPQSATFIL